ncbi:MAG: retropepsin-like domain-containing protein [Chloroflexi bacterium]|nr:retropepsin-like domain-containing protein [Candidatus Woesearchaeota archaeon]MBI5348066.1 retropepsin-like domain-containing protein [Chloroflexota bacterium]
MFKYNADFEPPAPCLDILVSHPEIAETSRTFSFQLDTGSDITVLPLNIVSELALPRAGEILVEGYDANQDQATIYFATLSIKNFVFRRVSILAIDRSQGLLGRDVLNLLVTNLNGPKLQFDLTTK